MPAPGIARTARSFCKRTSTGTYVDRNGVLQIAEPYAVRPVYTGGVFSGIIKEPTPSTNSALNSASSTMWSWLDGVTLTPNILTAPDGTLTGTTAFETATTAPHRMRIPLSAITVNALNTGSVFFSAHGRPRVQLILLDPTLANFVIATFDISGGTVAIAAAANGAASSPSATISPVMANGWYRCSVSGILDASSSTAYLYACIDNGSGISYLGITTNGVNAWGGNIVPGPLSSYIPTGASAATRTAD